MGITLLTLCLGFFVSSAHTIWSEQELLSEQLDERGRSLSSLASLSCVELLLGNDIPKLDSFVGFLATSHPDVVFCRIQRQDGRTVGEAGKRESDPAAGSSAPRSRSTRTGRPRSATSRAGSSSGCRRTS